MYKRSTLLYIFYHDRKKFHSPTTKETEEDFALNLVSYPSISNTANDRYTGQVEISGIVGHEEIVQQQLEGGVLLQVSRADIQ